MSLRSPKLTTTASPSLTRRISSPLLTMIMATLLILILGKVLPSHVYEKFIHRQFRFPRPDLPARAFWEVFYFWQPQ